MLFSLDTHALAVVLLTILALFLFTRPNLPLETSSLFVLAVLAAGFEIFPYEGKEGVIHAQDFFSGFGHEALVAVTALMIVGHGLSRTGALEPIGRMLARFWGIAPKASFLLMLLVGATLSAFVNNVPIVILLLPILTSVSLKTKTPASSILMPMGFATLIGGMGTTIGTSTNLLVVSVAVSMGMEKFSMFEFFLPVALSSGVAILYLWLVAPLILPRRESDLGDSSPRIFTAALHINEESVARGKTILEIIEKTDGAMKVQYIRRGDDDWLMESQPKAQVRAGDQILVTDTPERLVEFAKVLGADLFTSNKKVAEDNPLQAEGQQLAELIVTQGSPLENTSLARTRFADRYQLASIALHRSKLQGRALLSGIRDTQLQIGDVLLVQGASEKIAELKQKGEILVLDATADLPHSAKASLALGIMVSVVLVSASGLLPIAISAVCGVLLMTISKCLSWKEVGQAVNTQIVLIVAASLALGYALLQTGAADALASSFVVLTQNSSVAVKLSGLMFVMAVMTNIVSNNAAAVIGTPIAIGIANQLNLPMEPFVLAVLFGANMSYATPMAYKTNLLVMTVGGYTFTDFLKVGIPLTIIMWLSLSWLIPFFYQIA